jgi:hypothetical protein
MDLFSSNVNDETNKAHPPVPRLNLDRQNTFEGDILAGLPQKFMKGKETNY